VLAHFVFASVIYIKSIVDVVASQASILTKTQDDDDIDNAKETSVGVGVGEVVGGVAGA